MNDCLFCKMIAGEIPCDIVYENESVFAFRDIDPKAPTHILLIPRKHIRSINELGEPEQNLAGELLLTAKIIAKDEGIDESGFRIIFNTNSLATEQLVGVNRKPTLSRFCVFLNSHDMYLIHTDI